MIVSHVAQAAPAPSEVSTVSTRHESAPPPATITADTAKISNAAQAAAQAALQEATETLAQTEKEAQAGDHQAQRLMAKYEHPAQ
jgi:hypothetical protein